MRAVRNLHWTGLLREQPYREQIHIDIGDDHTRNIGVWGRSSPGRKVPFVRKPERQDEWFYWANTERIEARSAAAANSAATAPRSFFAFAR